MKKVNFLIFITIILSIFSCSKSPGDCFTQYGETITETRQIDAFNSILMEDNINVELIASNSSLIKLTTGQNLIAKIETKVVDSQLIIKNNNNCNFVRSNERPITARVYFQQLDSIEYRSIGDLTCKNNAITTDTFKIDVFEGAGNIDLEINNFKTYLNFHYGTANLKVTGFSQLIYLYQISYGPIDAKDLTSVFAYLENNSTNNTWIRANTVLEATINNIGNVYYFGNPQTERKGEGSGQLIKLD